MNIGLCIDISVREFGDFEIFTQGRISTSSVEMLDAAKQLAAGFIQLELRPGSRVLVVMPNRATTMFTYLAIWRAGLVAAPLHAASTSREIARIAERIDARAVVTTTGLLPRVVEAFASAPTPPPIVVWPDGNDLQRPSEARRIVAVDELRSSCAPLEEVRTSGDGLALLLFTGGTTGQPKAVMLSHENVWTTLHAMPNRQRLTSIVLFPMNHIAGITFPLANIRYGGRTVLSDTQPGTVLETIERTRADYLVSVPSNYIAMLVHPDAERFDTSSARTWMYGGAGMPEEQCLAIERRFGCAVHCAWGMTETAAPNTFTEISGKRKPGSCGQPMRPTKLRIVGPDGIDRPLGERGEVWASGPQVTQGYLDMPEATAGVLVDGWLRTGDLGWLDADGDLYLAGRSKDVILRGGENVYPEEIESVIAVHPAIVTCAVVGLPNELLGEEVVAYVVVRPGEDRVQIVAELGRNCREHLTYYKVPRFEVLDEMYTTTIGKIDRKRLREHGATLLDQQRDTPARLHLVRTPVAHRRAAMTELIVTAIGQLMQTSPVELGGRTGFLELGMTSAQAVELAFAIGTTLGVKLPSTLTFQAPSIEALAGEVLGKLGLQGENRAASAVRSRRRERCDDGDPIAIVGMAYRFPGGIVDDDSLWSALENGLGPTGAPPSWRWGDQRDSERVLGHLVADIDKFDPAFFGITPNEAREMDPQQRVLLEVAWNALENAGIAPSSLAVSPTGVYVGMGMMDYLYDHTRDGGMSALSGGLLSVAAGRISFVLGLRGPNIVVDTACSASLTATHLAVRALRAGECDLALAGGVSLCLAPQHFAMLEAGGVLSTVGRCLTFDAAADGYGRTEGCGVLVLARLSDAIERGYMVRALIRGSAINHDGASSSLTAPNGAAQEAVIRAALEDANLVPSDVSAIEAHGTGTPTGDPIEVDALLRVFGDRERTAPLYVSSLKAVVGHMELAAGVGGVIRSVLQLERQALTPMAHLSRLNPLLALDGTVVTIPRALTAWTAHRRITGVSSFGLSGSNAHVILEAAQALPERAEVRRSHHVLTLSAKSPAALGRLVERHAQHSSIHSDLRIDDRCYTASAGRDHYEHRIAIVATGEDDLRSQLVAAAAGEPHAGMVRATHGERRSVPSPVCMLFSGGASVRSQLGISLYDSEPVYRAALDECARELSAALAQPLLDVLFAPKHGEHARLLSRSTWVFPALFATQWALFKLWTSWGVTPHAVMGHSFGEYAAAAAAGVFSLQDACRLVAARGRLIDEIRASGTMMAIEASETDVAPVVATDARVSIAAVNGPRQVVVSGETMAVESIAMMFAARGCRTSRLAVAFGAHSPEMDPMLAPFREIARTVTYRAPAIHLASNVTGALVGTDGILDAEYWVRHIRDTVRFHAGMGAVAALGCKQYLEIGPDPVLLGTGAEHLPDASLSWVPSMRRGEDEWGTLARGVAVLYANGASIDWDAFHSTSGARRVSLPGYAFERRSFWVSRAREHGGSGARDDGALEHSPANDADALGPSLRDELAALPLAERTTRLCALVRGELEDMLGSLDLREDTRLAALGLDSLRAIELRNTLNRRLKLSLVVTEIVVGGSVAAVAARLAEHLGRVVAEAPSGPRGVIESGTSQPVGFADFDRTWWIDVGALRVAVGEWGPETGRAVVAVHGLLDQSLSWCLLAQHLARCGIRTVALDLPGHGLTDHALGTGGYLVDDALRAISAVRQRVGANVLLGHSLGALYTSGVAAAGADLLRGAILIDPPFAVGRAHMPSGREPALTRLRHSLELCVAPAHVVFETEAQAVQVMTDTLLPGIDAALVRALTRRLLRRVPGGQTWRSDPRIKLPLAGDALHDVLRSDTPQARKLPVLALFARPGISGRADRAAVRTAFPRVRVTELETGHWPHLEAPEQVARHIEVFLASLDRV